MMDFILPPESETNINVLGPDGSKVTVEVIDIYQAWLDAQAESKKLDTETWTPLFQKNMSKNFGVNISRTGSVLLVEVAVKKMTELKKSCSPEQES